MGKERLDQLLVQRSLAESREKAQRLVLSGTVMVDGVVQSKPGHQYREDVRIEVKEPERYVSRGGYKLEAALDTFPVKVHDAICVDVGASTGGFTDCLLQRGAKKVYAMDVGKGQLHWKLRQDDRVVVHDKVNARFLEPAVFEETPTLATIDVSFISLTKVLPSVDRILGRPGQVVALIKPQFEAGREKVGKGGVVRDAQTHQDVIDKVRSFASDELGWTWIGFCPSPLTGPAGNVEFLATWTIG